MSEQQESTVSPIQQHVVMPIQPIRDGRFVPNRIVETLLDQDGGLDLNALAVMDFTDEERRQFAQLIGYSLSAYGSLRYVNDETYDTAVMMSDGHKELESRNERLRDQLDEIREGLKAASVAAFKIHPDDLSA